MSSFAMLGLSALGQQASIPVEESQSRRYAQMEVENEWEYAEPQSTEHAVYGRGVGLTASHPFVKGQVGASIGSGDGGGVDPNLGGGGGVDPNLGGGFFFPCLDEDAINYGDPLPCEYDN